MPERSRVLQMGPDPSIGGGMSAALRGLLDSPLGEAYELDVVPTYRGPERLSGFLVFALALARLAVWSLRRRGSIVHIHATVRGSSYRKAVVVLVAKALRRRVVLHMHSGAGDIAHFSASRDRASLAFLRAAFGAADLVLAVSVASATALERGYGISAIEVVPNAAPTVAPFAREQSGPEDTVQVAYLGGFANLAKGGDVMLAALATATAREPRLRATLAGPGELPPLGAALLTGGRIEWVGWLEAGEKERLLREAPVFAMASRSEGLPMALLEAMAYGMAIATTDVGGIGEVAVSGETALLVAAERPEELADALCRLVADGELRARLGAAARERARSLDAVEVAGRLSALYARLIQGSASR